VNSIVQQVEIAQPLVAKNRFNLPEISGTFKDPGTFLLFMMAYIGIIRACLAVSSAAAFTRGSTRSVIDTVLSLSFPFGMNALYSI